MRKKYLAVAVLVFIGLALIIGYNFGVITLGSETTEKKPLYWIDSMEPQIHYPGPGKSRMGMELTPVYPQEKKGAEAAGVVQVSSETAKHMGVRTVSVKKGELARSIETVGYVEPNENKISHIHTYAEGWIQKLAVKAVGEPVKKGQLLIQLYSPQLVSVQEEYLIALESKNQTLINASYMRLKALRISEKQIEKIKQTRKTQELVDIYSPQDGIISTLNVREGMHVMPNTEIMSLVDLTNIWMIAQVLEDEAGKVKVGDTIEALLSAYPGKVWKGKIDYIYPQVDPMTRNVKVRFIFDNPDELLKPNMYANIKLLGDSKAGVLTIPSEALIRTSKGDHVVIALDGDRFEARTVVVGMESDDQVEILSGLLLGEKVVISGQFLIDSEANLKAGFERLEVHDHGHEESKP